MIRSVQKLSTHHKYSPIGVEMDSTNHYWSASGAIVVSGSHQY